MGYKIKSVYLGLPLLVGLAMFKMFFGAGNMVFSLAIGRFATEKTVWALLGLLLTAVIVPFIGVVAISLYKGNVREFFFRMGRLPGLMIMLAILALIGPCGAIPRCLILSYSSLQLLIPQLPLWLFSASACGLIFLCMWRKNRLMQILGYFFAPLLIILIAFLVVKGLWNPPSMGYSDLAPPTAFLHGALEGYNTLDLLPAFFFSSVIVSLLPPALRGDESARPLFSFMLKASAIGAVLIGIVYVGLSFLAAHYHGALRDVPHELLLGTLAWKILGPWGSIFTSCAVVLSCLATAIALATAFSDFLSQEILRTKHSDIICRLLTLVITFAFCFMGFSGIVKLLAPILRIGYPALFMLTLLNISHKLFQFDRGVKVVVPATFITTWLFDFLRLKT